MQPWTLLHQQHEGDYRIFDVHTHRLRSPRSGQTSEFYVIDAPNWVNVIPLTAQGEVVCVRQYRAGTHTVTLEIPGGMVDPGDDSMVAAGRRELREETGYGAERFIDMGDVHPNPALQSNRCGTVLAANAHVVGPPELDGSEEIDLTCIPLDDIPALILDGAISHALVVAGFYRFDLWRHAHPDRWAALTGETSGTNGGARDDERR